METRKSLFNQYVHIIVGKLNQKDDSWWSCQITDNKNRDWTLRIRMINRSGKCAISAYGKHSGIDNPLLIIEIEQYLLDENDITAIRLTIQNKLNCYKYY